LDNFQGNDLNHRPFDFADATGIPAFGLKIANTHIPAILRWLIRTLHLAGETDT
jgi:hypothetical protein